MTAQDDKTIRPTIDIKIERLERAVDALHKLVDWLETRIAILESDNAGAPPPLIHRNPADSLQISPKPEEKT